MTQQLEEIPSTPPTPPRMSYAQFLEWPHENPHVEWVDGEIVPMPPISDEHTHVGRFLINVLTLYVEHHQLGTLFYEPFQMKPGDELPGRAPDVFFVATANLQRIQRNHLHGPADVAIEVVSPESRTRDRIHKFKEYEQGGVREYWIIDPHRRLTEFYVRGDDDRYRQVIPEGGIYRSAVLAGFWLRVEWLWDRPPVMSVLKEWGLL